MVADDDLHDAVHGIGLTGPEEDRSGLGGAAEGDGVTPDVGMAVAGRSPEGLLDQRGRGAARHAQLARSLDPVHRTTVAPVTPGGGDDETPLPPDRTVNLRAVTGYRVAMAATQMGLRARKKQATSTALQRSAIDLFLERGYDETTVQDITDAAGVSQRTFFRYYATKDAVLLTEHTRRERELAELLASRPDEPLGQTAAAILEHLSQDIVERLELVRVQTRVSYTVPTLADRFAGHHDRLSEIIAAHVAGSLGVEVDADPRPSLVAHQVVACWTTAVHLWMVGGMEGDLRSALIDILTQARSDRALVDAG